MPINPEMLNAPGHYAASDLRNAAKEIEDFLSAFQTMAKLMSDGVSLNAGVVLHHLNTLRTTADIVEVREKLGAG